MTNYVCIMCDASGTVDNLRSTPQGYKCPKCGFLLYEPIDWVQNEVVVKWDETRIL